MTARTHTHAVSWGWRAAAKCRGADLTLFFHPDGERGNARRRRQQKAKQVCSLCPVVTECRAHAVAFEEAFGTWGGLSEDDRRGLLPDRVVRLRTHRASTAATDA
jgi:WhiB family transcriptional regulator, redox-sensing transcriptional regulator